MLTRLISASKPVLVNLLLGSTLLGSTLLGSTLLGSTLLGSALLGSALLMGCGPDKPAESPASGSDVPSDCATRQFNARNVQKGVKPAIVRLVAGKSTGTGFVLGEEPDSMLIVTNHHVIAEGDSFRAIFPDDDGKGAELGGLEVVKVDTENDLALLKAPKLANRRVGLTINPAGIELGQRIAAMGYPYVAGSDDFTLTFEPGDVSAVKRMIREREFVQTNANINPGNSGGPVVDACGTVVGVVVATSSQAERVGLVVPVKKLVALQKLYKSKPPPPKKGVIAALKRLEKAVQYKKGKDAAAEFSRGFTRKIVMPDFVKHIKRAEKKEDQYAALFKARGKDYYNVSIQARMDFLKTELPRPEFEAWLIAQMLKLKRVGVYEAMNDYLAFWVTDVFGDVQGLKVEEVTDATPKSATAKVKVTLPKTKTFWEFSMIYEWGDWRVEKAKCVRGC